MKDPLYCYGFSFNNIKYTIKFYKFTKICEATGERPWEACIKGVTARVDMNMTQEVKFNSCFIARRV